MHKIILIVAVLVLVVLVMSPAAPAQQQTQMPCGERGKILQKLAKDYRERPISLGLSSNGSLFEILASERGSWTMIYTRPEGGSCVFATGRSWEEVQSAKIQTPVAKKLEGKSGVDEPMSPNSEAFATNAPLQPGDEIPELDDSDIGAADTEQNITPKMSRDIPETP